jgi:hypothetical protein
MSDEVWMLRVKVARFEEALRTIASEDPSTGDEPSAVHALQKVQTQAHWALKDLTCDDVMTALHHVRHCPDVPMEFHYCGVCGAKQDVVHYLRLAEKHS